MPKVHVSDTTHLSPEQVLAAAKDFTENRAKFWPDVHVEIHADRHLKGRGLLTYPFFPLGLAKQTVAGHLRHFIDKIEDQAQI